MNKPFSPLRQALNKAYLKEKVARPDIERLKSSLRQLLQHINLQESETNIRDHLRDFLNEVWYRNRHLVASRERTDLVIHADAGAKSPPTVLFEVKRPKNTAEMIAPGQLNRKALHELVWYYLRERVEHQNPLVKTLVITDIHTWFLFSENDFDRYVYHNKKLLDFYLRARENEKNTDLIYKTIGRDFLPEFEQKLGYTYFDLRDYAPFALDNDPDNDRNLIPLYKGLSPVHLLRLPFANDSNSLDKTFYHELLHVIGLEEVKDGGKKLIRRKKAEHRHPGALLENTIAVLDTEDVLRRLPNAAQYGADLEEQRFQVALELVITWVNRLLFLKLLESQLRGYQGGNTDYLFLNFKRIQDFDELNELFFDVLAKRPEDRPAFVRDKFALIPYLNSSLFEITELESRTLRINSLKDRLTLPLLANTVLKDNAGRRQHGELRTLDYLFQFLDAYDFASEGGEEISEENKTLINASVLGLIFEKINGYRDGSFFTPGFITMYMCRETIRRSVVQKFNGKYGWTCEDLEDLRNHLIDRRSKEGILESNALINTLKVCDPAVGSGHFLVSALNEIIAVKSELGVLADERGMRLPVEARVENDELIVSDEQGFFRYQLRQGRALEENQRIQQTLFREKQRIIENCLFGVDINPNSVKICRLRLWIELLKNAYYTERGELETLPNIDINIKQGNSLVSRFALDADLSRALKSLKYDIPAYKGFVRDYHRATDREVKLGLIRLIDQIKSDFRTEIGQNDPKRKRLDKLMSELYHRFTGHFLFEPDAPYGKDEKDLEKKRKQEKQKLEQEIEKLSAEIEEIKSNRIFENAFEWRFEFPEVLDEEGRFTGFDVVVGNPPYIRQEELTPYKPYLQNHYRTFAGTADLYVYFVELGVRLLREGGHFSYILPNKWMRAGYGDKLRQFVKSLKIRGVSDFGDLPVFEEATTYPCVLELQQAPAADTFLATNIATLDFEESLPAYIRQHAFPVALDGLQDSGWTLTNQSVQHLLDKLRNAGTPLSDYVQGKIYRGVLTGLNEAFVIDAATRERLIAEDPRSAEVIKPFLAGRDIKRYQTPVSVRYLIFTRRGIAIEQYPAILRHLEQYKEKLMPQPKNWTGKEWPGRKPGAYQWYEIQDAVDYYGEFEKEKIIIPAIIQRPQSIIDSFCHYSNDKTTIVGSNKLMLLALLNSFATDFFMQNISSTKQGGFFEYKPVYIAQIPIPAALPEQQSAIESLVVRILDAKRADPSADTAALEAEIDRHVYALYGLTEAEIALVEGSR